MNKSRIPYKTIIAVLIPLFLLVIPTGWIPLEGLTIIEKRVLALFVLAALFWVLEPIPIFATSILIITLELILISDQGFLLFRTSSPAEQLGTLLDYRSIMGTFASPIILLFLGGFFLTMAATKYRLDQNLARVLLRPFGQKPHLVMLGLMVITATFSMFMSNTATTAMMLSILVPVLALFEEADKGRVAYTLSIPLAANIGGIATPIGTPPNAIALKYLTGNNAISFSEWMGFGVPFVIILLLISWYLLQLFYPIHTKSINLAIKGRFLKTSKAIIVYITFGATILLWLTDFLHGMNAYVVALIPVAVFLSTRIITKEDLKLLSWDVLWLVSGGIALGLALEESGLAARLVNSIPFAQFPAYLIMVLACVLALVMANFMSNTATANLLLPIIAALGASLPALEGLGGVKALVLSTTLASSLGMALPISTPPNALAHATGTLQTADLTRMGIYVGIIGLGFVLFFMFILKLINFF